jgi:hypothetical protein
MNTSTCEHFNRINHCEECQVKVYTAKVVFKVMTKLGVLVEDSVRHVDYKHAQNWVNRMGNKIIDPTIIF